jgi:hypothetical protein
VFIAGDSIIWFALTISAWVARWWLEEESGGGLELRDQNVEKAARKSAVPPTPL